MRDLERELKAKGLNNFHVTDQRYATIWGGTSLLEMFLDVVRTALSDAKWNKWDYILNLSETDMPVLSLSELEYNLAQYAALLGVSMSDARL